MYLPFNILNVFDPISDGVVDDRWFGYQVRQLYSQGRVSVQSRCGRVVGWHRTRVHRIHADCLCGRLPGGHPRFVEETLFGTLEPWNVKDTISL